MPTEVADDVMFGVIEVSMVVRVKFGDSTLNSGRIIRLVAGHTRFMHFCAVFHCMLQLTGNS